MELGVLNKIDRELNNSGNKNPDQNADNENYEEKQNNGFSNNFFITHQKSIKLQHLIGLQDKQESNLIMVLENG